MAKNQEYYVLEKDYELFGKRGFELAKEQYDILPPHLQKRFISIGLGRKKFSSGGLLSDVIAIPVSISDSDDVEAEDLYDEEDEEDF